MFFPWSFDHLPQSQTYSQSIALRKAQLTSSLFLLSEPLPHTENSPSNNDSSKDSGPNARAPHIAVDYRATKRERPYYATHSHTPPPLRRVSSNPSELGQVPTHRRVEGRITESRQIFFPTLL